VFWDAERSAEPDTQARAYPSVVQSRGSVARRSKSDRALDNRNRHAIGSPTDAMLIEDQPSPPRFDPERRPYTRNPACVKCHNRRGFQ
jgi:hypothetical protein